MSPESFNKPVFSRFKPIFHAGFLGDVRLRADCLKRPEIESGLSITGKQAGSSHWELAGNRL